jgi:hypothetical protein
VYWASRHYEELARIRREQGVPVAAQTPSFLRRSHAQAMDERPYSRVEHKVRRIARRAIRRED